MPRSKRITKSERQQIKSARRQRRFVNADEMVLVNRNIRSITR